MPMIRVAGEANEVARRVVGAFDLPLSLFELLALFVVKEAPNLIKTKKVLNCILHVF